MYLYKHNYHYDVIHMCIVVTIQSLYLPINVFGNSSSSHDNGKRNDTSVFGQKPYLRSIYIEVNIEEDINMRKSI